MITKQLSLRCRLCGTEGKGVSAGIWKSTKGKYHTIPRCEDHAACAERNAAI